MSAILDLFNLSAIHAYIGVILVAIVGVLMRWSNRAGKKSERRRQEEARRKAMTEGQRIEQEVAGNSPGDNRKKLKGWSR